MTRTIVAEPVLNVGADLGEGPLWHAAEHTLDWVDITAGKLHRYDPRTHSDIEIDVGQALGAFAARRAGGYVLAVEQGFAILEGTGPIKMVAEIENGQPRRRMNDGKCDSAGRFWAGTMAYDFTPGAGSLYRLDPDFTVTTMVTGVTISNGMDWTDDDRTMYYIDTPTRGVDAFDFDAAAGAITNRRRLIDIPFDSGTPAGRTVPDGMTLDSEGFLWVAVYGSSQVRRYSPQGELDVVVELPVSAVTSCAFGGDRLSDLYITSLVAPEVKGEALQGALFRCEPGVTGRPPNLFAG